MRKIATNGASPRNKLYGRLGDLLAGLVGPRVELPAEATCPECSRYDAAHPAVARCVRVLERTGGAGGMAGEFCNCSGWSEGRALSGVAVVRDAGLLPGFMDATVDSFHVRPKTEVMLQAVRAFINREGPKFLVLQGPPGIGKTHLLHAIAHSFIGDDLEARYVIASALVDQLRQANNESVAASPQRLVREYQTVPLLLLDDLGLERWTVYSEEMMARVIELRLQSPVYTVVATNKNFEQLVGSSGHRVASRVLAANPLLANQRLVTCRAADFRQPAGA